MSVMALGIAVGAFAFPKALYVKKGDNYTRYNFGVAGDLKFTNNGRSLTISGYNEVIDLDKVDYITFNSPANDNALTPSEQKEKMLEIGEEINGRINMKENAAVIKLFNYFLDHVGDEGEGLCPPSEFDVPEEYWNVHPRNLMKALEMVGRLNPAGATRLENVVADLYKVEDYVGIYEADYENRVWKKISDADFFEMRFTPPVAGGSQYAVRLTPSSDYTEWDSKDGILRLPKQSEILLLENGGTLGKLLLDITLKKGESIDLAVNGNVGTAGVEHTMSVKNDGVDSRTYVTNKGEYFTEINQHLDGRNLLDYDTMYEDVKQSLHKHDEAGECIDGDPHALFAHFIRGNVRADVINRLQVKGMIGNPAKLYDLLQSNDNSEDDNYEIEYKGYTFYTYDSASQLNSDKTILNSKWNDDPTEYKKYSSALNDYCDVSFYYDGTETMQGFMGFDVDEEVDEYPTEARYVAINNQLVSVEKDWEDKDCIYGVNSAGEWMAVDLSELGFSEKDIISPIVVNNRYCEVIPILIFPDMTSFSFTDYFDEVSFKNLKNDYEDIIDTYYEITGQVRPEYED